jgi:hypothetical protein
MLSTNNFSTINQIGQGGFGSVYKVNNLFSDKSIILQENWHKIQIAIFLFSFEVVGKLARFNLFECIILVIIRVNCQMDKK